MFVGDVGSASEGAMLPVALTRPCKANNSSAERGKGEM